MRPSPNGAAQHLSAPLLRHQCPNGRRSRQRPKLCSVVCVGSVDVTLGMEVLVCRWRGSGSRSVVGERRKQADAAAAGGGAECNVLAHSGRMARQMCGKRTVEEAGWK